MKMILLLLLLSTTVYDQNRIIERNMHGKMEIQELFLCINDKLVDSPELNKEASESLLEWIEILGTGIEEPLTFEGKAGYMTICNAWLKSERNQLPLIKLILRNKPTTLLIRNEIDDMYKHILGSTQIGVAMYSIKLSQDDKDAEEIYMALFR